MSEPRDLRALGAIDVVTGVLLALGDLVALPMRWWPVDALLLGLATLFVAGGAALLARKEWAPRLALAAGSAALVAGLGLATALTLSAAHIYGMYGPVGQGGAVLLAVVAALLVPYLVLLPAAQVYVLLPHDRSPLPPENGTSGVGQGNLDPQEPRSPQAQK